MEEWRDIEGFEGFYQVSNRGRIKSFRRKGTKKEIFTPVAYEGGHGYPIIALRGNGLLYKPTAVHRLVAKAFIPNPLGYKDVNHIDFNRSNNNVENLEWCTRGMNLRHSAKAGRMAKPKGELSATSKLKDIEINEIRYKHSQGKTYKELATQYGTDPKYVYLIVTRRARKHTI